MIKKAFSLTFMFVLILLTTIIGVNAEENLVFLDGCVYEASSTYFEDSCLPTDAFDGNSTTKWGSKGVNNKPGDKTIDVDEWIQVTFPEPVVISELYLLQDTEWSNIFEYELLVKEGENWRQVHKAEYTEQFPDETIKFESPVLTTTFRVHITKAGPETSSCNFYEIEVYGMTEVDANATPSPTPTEAPVTETPDVTNTPKTTASSGDSEPKDSNITPYIILAICIIVIVSIIAILVIKRKKKS